MKKYAERRIAVLQGHELNLEEELSQVSASHMVKGMSPYITRTNKTACKKYRLKIVGHFGSTRLHKLGLLFCINLLRTK